MINYLMLILMIPVIGLVDYLLFRKLAKCPKCGYGVAEWHSYIIPTFIEVMMFLAGVAVGAQLFK